MRTAGIWFDMLGTDAKRIDRGEPRRVRCTRTEPTPDILFEDRLALTVDGSRIELLDRRSARPIDCCVVWLPEHRIALVSNLFGPLFPHFPNLNTIRGDKYRFVEPQLATNRMVRELQPEVLVTGRHEPIVGADLIDASLERLHDAVTTCTSAPSTASTPAPTCWTLMREIELPPELRVGQGYGKVAWAVRTFWEEYVGWFRLQSTTELYPSIRGMRPSTSPGCWTPRPCSAGDRQVGRRRAGPGPDLAEAVLAHDGGHAGAKAVARDAQQALLDAGDADNFWAAGWLRDRIAGLDA